MDAAYAIPKVCPTQTYPQPDSFLRVMAFDRLREKE